MKDSRYLPVLIVLIGSAFLFGQAETPTDPPPPPPVAQPAIGHSVVEFGADPTGRADSWDAFREAIKQGGRIIVPRGIYKFSKSLPITNEVHLIGEMYHYSRLQFAEGGLVVHNWITADAAGYGRQAGNNSIIEGLAIYGTPTAEGTHHGIDLLAPAFIEHCWIEGFTGNGLNVNADANSNKGNANRWRVANTTFTKCENGIYTKAGDSNAGSCFACDFRVNRGFGIWEESFLGNTYAACHIGYNGGYRRNPNGTYVRDEAGNRIYQGGAIYSPKVNARNTFVGCYIEGDPVCYLSPGDVAVGGVSFDAHEIQGPGKLDSEKALVLNRFSSRIQIREHHSFDMTVGGFVGDNPQLIAFKPKNKSWHQCIYEPVKNYFGWRWRNSPSHELAITAEGSKLPPITVAKALVYRDGIKDVEREK